MILAGTISLCIGLVGIVVPGLPTTPFLLLTAGLYVKSSDRLYNTLISNRLLGKYIRTFQKERGLSLKSKLTSIAIMWIMISISCLFMIRLLTIQVIVLIIGVIGTIVMGFVVPTVTKSDSINK
jgi:hypothetical protein